MCQATFTVHLVLGSRATAAICQHCTGSADLYKFVIYLFILLNHHEKKVCALVTQLHIFSIVIQYCMIDGKYSRFVNYSKSC